MWDKRTRRPMERFEEKYEVRDDGCWQWLAGTTHHGYGTFCIAVVDGVPKRQVAHRWHYEQVRGPVPDGLVLDHLCRNRACVNPDHLEPVTIQENVLRGETVAARNLAKTECDEGHPLSGDNLRVLPNGTRVCVECARGRVNKWAEGNREDLADYCRDWRASRVEVEGEVLSQPQVKVIGELRDHYIDNPRGSKLRSLRALERRGLVTCWPSSGRWLLTHKGHRAHSHLFADDMASMGDALDTMWVRAHEPSNVTPIREAE